MLPDVWPSNDESVPRTLGPRGRGGRKGILPCGHWIRMVMDDHGASLSCGVEEVHIIEGGFVGQ